MKRRKVGIRCECGCEYFINLAGGKGKKGGEKGERGGGRRAWRWDATPRKRPHIARAHYAEPLQDPRRPRSPGGNLTSPAPGGRREREANLKNNVQCITDLVDYHKNGRTGTWKMQASSCEIEEKQEAIQA